MSDTKRLVGSHIDRVPMEPSTRKDMIFKFVKPGELAPHQVLGGVVMEESEEHGVVILSEGAVFLTETLMANWLCEMGWKVNRNDSPEPRSPMYTNGHGDQST